MKILTPVASDDPSVDLSKSTKVYRCAYNSSGVVTAPGNPSNLYDSFKTASFKFGDLPALGWRPVVNSEAQDFEFMAYSDFDEKVTNIGSALKAVGIKKGSCVGMYGANSAEWMIAMKSVDFCGGIAVPLYDTFGPDAVEFIVKHSAISVVFCALNKLKEIIKVLPKVKDQVIQVVVWNTSPGVKVPEDAISEAEATGVPITLWDKFAAFGVSNRHDPSPGGYKDLCTIMYTSGTTGQPKGVEVTHESVITTSAALLQLMEHIKTKFGTRDVYLSYLPLAHIFGRVVEETLLCIGGCIGYWQGDPKKLLDDVGALRPTIFAGVPRIFDRLYSAVTQKVAASSPLSQFVFNTLFKIKQFLLRFGMTSVPVLDDIAFAKVKARLGGRVRVVVSGGAPLARHVEEFLKVTMCAPVAQGYGLTETCGGSFVSNPYRQSECNTVGGPLPGLDMRLESIPEMGYDACTLPYEGEVCLRGPAVFVGYHKRADLTEKDKYAGWFHTGDVGRLESDGALRIIDRKKNIFKLAHGEYIAAEKLENEYKKSPLVDQIWVHGDSEQTFIIAVIVPAEGAITSVSTEQQKAGDEQELLGNKDVLKAFQQNLEQIGRASGMKGFEIVKSVYLFSEPFSTDNDLMTPSFKLKRPQLKARFATEIAAMYSSGPL